MSANKKILIVDDEDAILRLLDIELSTEGHKVITAKSGEEAIKKAKALAPDLILMDILMPDMDGAQAIAFLKSDKRTQNIPVVFLTAMLKKEETNFADMGIKIQDTYYKTIAKPFDHQEFLNVISDVKYK